MKKSLLITLLIFSIQSVSSQKLYLQGGANYSMLSMDFFYFYNPFESYFQKDLFTKGYFGYGLSAGMEFFDENRATLLIQLQFNNLGGKFGNDAYSQFGKENLGVSDKFTLNQLSLNPILKYKLIEQDIWNLYTLSGLKVDFNISHSAISNNSSSPFYPIVNNTFNDQMNTLGLSVNFGMGAEFSISDKLSIPFNILYNQHISHLSYKDIRNTNGQKPYIYSSINFFQFQTGFSFKL